MRSLIILLTTTLVSSISAAIIFPSIRDEVFPGFSYNGQVPRIGLTYVHGVPTLPFSIGTPAQNFVGIFDTSSPITWVMSEKCNSTACLSVPSSEKYHPDASKTNFKLPFKVDLSYLDGSHVQLKPEFDTITFDGKFTIRRHLVAEAYQVDYIKGYDAPANARLGMGDFGSIDWGKTDIELDTDPIRSFFDSQRRAVGDDRYSTGYQNSGSISFRRRSIVDSFVFVLGVDQALYKGPIYKLPLIPFLGLRSPFWKMPISGFQLTNNRTVVQQFNSVNGAYGKIDSSTPMLTIPANIADAINKALGATYNPVTNLNDIDCSMLSNGPALVIQFAAGVDAEIPTPQYIYQNKKGCYTAIAAGADTNVYLGGPFFRSFYLVFHFLGLNVGIAQSSATGSDVGRVYPSSNLFIIPEIIG